jgi:hypothetical protein
MTDKVVFGSNCCSKAGWRRDNGEHGLQSGEGRSRSDLGLPGVQQELLEF